MSDQSDQRWARHLARLKDDPNGKALGVMVALASEVFLLKAENRRLRLALEKRGGLSHADEVAAGNDAEFRKWLQAEQAAFSRAVFKPWLEPDESPDTSAEYEREMKVKI